MFVVHADLVEALSHARIAIHAHLFSGGSSNSFLRRYPEYVAQCSLHLGIRLDENTTASQRPPNQDHQPSSRWSVYFLAAQQHGLSGILLSAIQTPAIKDSILALAEIISLWDEICDEST